MIFLKEMKLIVTHFNTPICMFFLSVQFSSVTRSCLTLCNPMDCSTSGCWWCHPTISSSVVPFSSHLQSFPASGSVLPVRWPKYWSFRTTHWKDCCWSWNAKVLEVLLMEYYIFIFTVSSVTNFKQWCEHYFL